MEPIVHIAERAVRRLADLGLSTEVIHQAIKAGDGESRTWTDAAPRSMGGMARWGRTNESLRILLGWPYENPSNLPLTVNPDRSFALFATSGDERTGREGKKKDEQPTTRYAKGAATERAVKRNEQLTIDFPDEFIGETFAKTVSSENLVTWILLYQVADDGIYLEVSLPESISRKGYIETWRERIIVEPYKFTPEPDIGRRRDDGDSGYEVAVERR